MSSIDFSVAPDKKDTETRIARGVAVSTHAPQSSLYTGDTKIAVDNVIARTVALKANVDDYSVARATLKKARTALGAGLIAWDGAYDILITNGENVCATPDDGASLALPVVGGKTSHPFAMPISVDVKQDLKRSRVRIHVHRAPGMKACCVQITTDLTNPALWKELDGIGAIHDIPTPPPGTTLSVRAATRGPTSKSDYTMPVSIVVK